MTDTERLQEMVDASSRIVFMTGAGMSTESGIADFRSENGMFETLKKYGERPETLLSHTYFMRYPDRFYEYYTPNFILDGIKPNKGHYVIAELEAKGKVSAVVTQNVDTLHTIAGSRKVYELHGAINRNFCMRCHREYDEHYVKAAHGVPHCECGGILKPDVVLYEEALDEECLRGAAEAISQADMLIVCGTSLVVYPAAGLVQLYRGKRFVIINRDPTPYDREADLVIHRSIGDVLGALKIDR